MDTQKQVRSNTTKLHVPGNKLGRNTRHRKKYRSNNDLSVSGDHTDKTYLFGKLSISAELSQAIIQLGYENPTPIQESVIPLIKKERDVVGQAQTGTGKTAAFGIPITEMVDQNMRGTQALILVPTRELALQVETELGRLGKFKKVITTALYGGQPILPQIKALNQNPSIIVATPGRLLDHMERKTVDLSKLKMVVLDEADQMLDIGFAPDLEKILRRTPKLRQTLLFSATMPNTIKRLSQKYMRDPVWILIGGESEPVDQVNQWYYEVAERDRYSAIEELLYTDQIAQALVFRRTKLGVDKLVSYLKHKGHDVQAIHSDITQTRRNSVMNKFRSRKLRILIATNVAARGLDIPAVSHVINYDIPENVEDYVHRIGRTARMGKPGTAITFVSEYDFEMLEAIQSHVGDGLKAKRLAMYGG